LEESIAVIGATTLRLNKSIEDLSSFIRMNDSVLSRDQLEAAEQEIESAQQLTV
jgi:hypothetical protein